MKKTLCTLLAALSLSACVASDPDTAAKLDAKPHVTGGSFTAGGGITVAADIREKDGKTMVCGVWADSYQTPAKLRDEAMRVVATGVVYVGNERVAQNLLFMREVEPQHRYGGLPADCRLTARPRRPGDNSSKLKIRIPKQTLKLSSGSSGIGQTVYFTQTVPGAGTPDQKPVKVRELLYNPPESRNLPGVPMPRDPFVMKFNYKPYGQIMIAATIAELNGKLAVCGFWTKTAREQSYVKSTNLIHKTRANSKVTMGGRILVQNLLFMNQVHQEDFLSGKEAKCRQTDLAWKSGYSNDAIAIRSPRLTTFE